VEHSTVCAHKGAEGYISVGASVVLAVNAKGIKLVLVDFEVEIRSLLC
jgi:septum formation inhibitor-activating ATPase MinD